MNDDNDKATETPELDPPSTDTEPATTPDPRKRPRECPNPDCAWPRAGQPCWECFRANGVRMG